MPPIPERYYSVAILDAYFNNFAIVSPRTFGNDGGAYLLVPPGWNGTQPPGVRAVFHAPTPSICLLQRIYVRNIGEYAALHALQDAIRLTPLDAWQQGTGGFPLLDLAEYAISGLRTLRDPLQFFAHTNTYTGVNLPPPGDAGLAALFQTAGVGPGSQLPAEPAARQAIVEGAGDAQAVMNARISAGPFRSGWRVPDPSSGIAGGPVLTRAAVQATQMGLFPLEEAIYFFGYRDGDDRALHGSNSYTITFKAGELPPLRQYGFWSLTMYGENSLLVENPIARYCLRPDTPGLTYAADGSLTLHLQHAQPQAEPLGNWLPAPQGTFNVAMRTYQPQDAIVSGAWFPPAIVRVS